MPASLKNTASCGSANSHSHHFFRAVAILVIAASLIAFGIVVQLLPAEERVLGQGNNNPCSETPVEPRNVELWGHSGGILVQWDVCPNHTYEIRWRYRSEPVANPINWPNTEKVDQGGEFDITGLRNERRYIVQLRPIHVENNRIDRGRWTDDFFSTPQYCGDLPEIPTGIRVLGGDSKIVVSWNRCSGMRSHIRWRSVVDDTANEWSSPVDVGGSTSYEIAGLENGVSYDVQLRSAISRSGRATTPNGEPYRTEWSTSVSGSPTSVCPEDGPIMPKNFVVVPGNGKLFVSWRPCHDHDYELAYRPRGISSNSEWPISSDWRDVDIGGHTIDDLDNGTRYEVRLRSVRNGSTSDATGPYVVSPQRPPSNNRSPSWKSVPPHLQLLENQNYDNPIAIVEAVDPDRDDEIRYEIVPPSPRPKLFPFAINARNGEVYLYGKLDYEVIEQYELTVRATDMADVEITQIIRVEVSDAEGPSPPVLYRVCSTADGVTVAWSGDISRHSFQLQHRLLSFVSFPERNLIELDKRSYTTSALIDNTTYVFRVRAIDNLTGEQSKWSSEEAVFVGRTANNAPKFRKDDWLFDIVEEQPAGAHVGFVVAKDQDPHSSLRFRIFESTPEDAPFDVNPFTGAITTANRLDFETQSRYSLVVGATDLCGSSDYTDATITVVDDPDIDAAPLIPNAPALIVKRGQVIVLWPTNYKDTYDLDWRKVSEDYLARPEDADATMPRIVDLADPDSAYVFRLRRVNQLGEVGDWSDEAIINTDISPPSIEPKEVPRQGQVLGGVELYIPGITLKRGQTARLGFNMFGVDGVLDNSLIDRRDVTAYWNVSDGDISDENARVVHYTAPAKEGVYSISIVAKQTVPGGIVQHDLEMAVHVVGDNQLIKPYVSGGEAPRNFEVDGVTYGTISYFQAKEYRPPEASKVLFKVREKSIPSFEWIGVRIAPGDDASTLQSYLDGYTAVGDIFTSRFVTKDGTPIINMSFTSSAALCLPVPTDWEHLLQSLHVMRLGSTGEQVLLDLPVRFQPDPTFNDPALACGHSALFDGQLFLAILDGDIVHPTFTPTVSPTPTEAPVPSPTVEPTIPPTDTPTAMPTPDTSSAVIVYTPTHTPTFTSTVPPTPTEAPVPSPTVEPTVAPTDTPTAIPARTHTTESMPTRTPMPTATYTSTSTPEPTVIEVSPELPTATLMPTETPVPSETPTPTATYTLTVVPIEVPIAAVAPTEPPTVTPQPTNTPMPLPTSEYEQMAPLDEDESRESGIDPLIIAALIAFLIIGTAVVSFSIYHNRAQRHLASAPEPVKESEEANGSDATVDDEPEAKVDNDDNDADDEIDNRYDRLRYDS